MEIIEQMAKNMDTHGAFRIANALNDLLRQVGEQWVIFAPYGIDPDRRDDYHRDDPGDHGLVGLERMSPDDLTSLREKITFEDALIAIAREIGEEAAFWVVYGRMPLEDVLGPRDALTPAPA